MRQVQKVLSALQVRLGQSQLGLSRQHHNHNSALAAKSTRRINFAACSTDLQGSNHAFLLVPLLLRGAKLPACLISLCLLALELVLLALLPVQRGLQLLFYGCPSSSLRVQLLYEARQRLLILC